MRRKIVPTAIGFLFLVSFALEIPGLQTDCLLAAENNGRWGEFPTNGGDREDNALRQLVGENVPPGKPLYLLLDGTDALSKEERYVQIELAFDRCPSPVAFGGLPDVPTNAFVLASKRRWGEVYRLPFLNRVASTEKHVLFAPVNETDTKSILPLEPIRDVRSSAILEFAGWSTVLVLFGIFFLLDGFKGAVLGIEAFSVAVLAAALGPWNLCRLAVVPCAAASLLVVWLTRSKGEGEKYIHCRKTLFVFVCIAVLYVAMLGFVILSHSAISPSNLGTVGGRAKWIWSVGNLRSDLFRNPSYSLFEPAYPPGLMCFALVADIVSGLAGQWLSQLASAFVISALFLFVLSRTVRPLSAIALAAIFLSPPGMEIAKDGHPEAFAALSLIVGCHEILARKNGWTGWFLLGMSAWFKFEGFIFAAAFWLACRIVRGRDSASYGRVLAGWVFPLFWICLATFESGEIHGWSLRGVGLSGFSMALQRLARYAWSDAWQLCFAIPFCLTLAVCSVFSTRIRRHLSDNIVIGIIQLLVCLAVFPVIYSFSTANDIGWHVRTSLHRVIWTPCLLFWYLFLTESMPELNGTRPLSRSSSRASSPRLFCGIPYEAPES